MLIDLQGSYNVSFGCVQHLGYDNMILNWYFFILLVLAASPAPSVAQPMEDAGELVLVPGDILRVVIWREENLSGDFQVDQDGTLVLPLLGKQQVDDRVWSTVRDNLMEDYLRELRNPSIELTPYRSVYVLGEVNLPGRYNVHPTNGNLAGAVSLAGGITLDGDVMNVRVVRDGEIVLDGITGEQSLAILGVRSGDQLFVGRRSWIDRNSTFLVSAVLSIGGVIAALIAGGGG